MNKKIAILIITICLILLSISPINASSNGTDGIQAIDDGTDGIQAIDDAPVGEIIQDVDDESKVKDYAQDNKAQKEKYKRQFAKKYFQEYLAEDIKNFDDMGLELTVGWLK